MIIVGSLIFIFAATPVSGIYGKKNLEDRMAMITARRGAFVISQVGFGLGSLLTAVGFLLLTLHLRDSQSPWPNYAAAVSLVMGAILWAVFIYQRTLEPETMFGDYLGSRIMWVSFVFTEIGLVLYGVVFLQSSLPQWLGYASFAVAAAMLVGALTIPGWLPPQIIYLLTLVVGIVVRQ